ncbi:unnamed protein product [Chrysoparadoxa australica]
METIFFSEAMSLINRPNSIFSLGFRKSNGDYSEKDGVINRSKTLSDRKKMNRSGLLSCYQPQPDYIFDVTIDLIMTLNGMRIIRPEENQE